MAEVVLEDATLLALARRPDVVVQFPELRPLASLPARCCNRRGPDTTAIKQALRYLSDERKLQLKQILGATRLRLYVRSGGGVQTSVW